MCNEVRGSVSCMKNGRIMFTNRRHRQSLRSKGVSPFPLHIDLFVWFCYDTLFVSRSEEAERGAMRLNCARGETENVLQTSEKTSGVEDASAPVSPSFLHKRRCNEIFETFSILPFVSLSHFSRGHKSVSQPSCLLAVRRPDMIDVPRLGSPRRVRKMDVALVLKVVVQHGKVKLA